MWDTTTLRCPWCGERFEALIDPGGGSGDYVEDCAVCCKPIEMHLDQDGDRSQLSGERGD